MKKLEPAVYRAEQVVAIANELLEKWKRGDKEIREQFATHDEDIATHMIVGFLREHYENEKVFKNDVYQVAVRQIGADGVHLSIKRIDKKPVHDWRDLQEIKNQLVGRECEGVELYPAESRRVDTSNQFHIWCITDPKHSFPFGFNGGRFVTDDSLAGSVNRPLPKEEKT